MAQVPTYDTPQVGPDNVPQSSINVQTNPNMFGESVGKAISNVGSAFNENAEVGKSLLQMQQTVAGSQALNESLKYYQDRSEAFYKLRGSDMTPQAVQQYREDLQQHFTDTLENLSPYARMHYMEWSARYLNNYQESAIRYADQQQRVGLSNEGQKTIDLAIRNAGMGANDATGKSLAEARLLMQNGIEKVAKANDMQPFQVDDLTAKAGKQFDAEIIKNQMQNPALAQDLKERLGDPDWRKQHFPYTDDSDAAVYISRIDAQQTKEISKQGFAGMTSTSGARGIRNNNPGNLVESGIQWQGLSGKDETGKAIFRTPEEGIRALAIDLHNQGALHDKYTVEDIIGRYAPPDENNTKAYQTFVANYMGVSPKERIDLNDPNTLTKMTNAIITYENRGNPYPKDMVRNAALVASAHLPNMGGQLQMAEGNPAAQMEIASNAAVTTDRKTDEANIAALPEGPAKQNAQMAMLAKWEVLDPVHGDPAGYIQSKMPELNAQLTFGLQHDPSVLPGVIDQMDNVYDNLGIKPEDRHYLPNAIVENIVNSTLIGTPQQALSMMEDFEKQTGILWPKFHNDIGASMPVWWQTAAGTDDMSVRAQMARAAQGFTTEETPEGRRSNEEILKMLPRGKESLTEINKALDTNPTLVKLRSSLQASGATNGEIASYVGFTQRLAVQKMAEEGMSAEDAAAKSVNDVIGDKFKFIDNARVPTERYDLVRGNADYALETTPKESFNIPTDSYSDWAWYYSMKYGGSWKSGTDGNSMVRLDHSNKVVYKKDGTPFSVPFSAIDNRRQAIITQSLRDMNDPASATTGD